MHIALYSPSVGADPGRPSGVGAATGALRSALEIAGHHVVMAGDPGAFDDPPASDRSTRPHDAVETQIAQILDACGPPDRRPAIWITYGPRIDAPDLLGPRIAATLGIPYVVIDPRRPGPSAGGGEAAMVETLRTAATVIPLSDAGASWVAAAAPAVPLLRLLPFIDPAPLESVRLLQGHRSASITMRLGLDNDTPRLLCVSAMRPGDRLDSYTMLARALSRLVSVPWRLIVVGDGPARPEVEAMLRRLPLGRVLFTGTLPPEEVMPYYAISDLLVAPSVGGTHGRVLLEAQASGLPVVAGDTPGVRDVVRDGITGRLCPAGNAESLSQSVALLLRQRSFLDAYAAASTQVIARDHHIVSAAARLNEIVTGLISA